MGVKIEKKKIAATVAVEKKTKGATKSSKDTQVPVAELVTKTVSSDVVMANVGCSMAYTKNLGNYEAVKVTVSLFYPSEPAEKAVDQCFKMVQGWVDKKLNEVIEEIALEAEG